MHKVVDSSGAVGYNYTIDPNLRVNMTNKVIPSDSMTEWFDLHEYLQHTEEFLAETEGQHLAEVNHYGDSWPGAQLHINSLKQSIIDTKRKIQELGFNPTPINFSYDDICF